MKSYKEKLVLIGASTGGPGQLKKMFLDLPSNIKTPIVVAQHMGSDFIPSFVEQFKNELNSPVFGLSEECVLDKGGIYICEKNFLVNKANPLKAKPKSKQEATLYNPNVDALFNSATAIAKEVDIMAILLTGIGNDGADGLMNLAKLGAFVMGEHEDSAIVYGMPKQAKELNIDLKMLTLAQIKLKLESFIDVF